eukprot:scaffold11377_cov47-Cyclotella_meneghiniana.AAC.1
MLPAGTITSALLAKKFPRFVVHVSKRNENLKNSEPVWRTVRSERLDCADLFVFGMRDEKAKKAILGSIEQNEKHWIVVNRMLISIIQPPSLPSTVYQAQDRCSGEI